MSPVHADEPDCGRTAIDNNVFRELYRSTVIKVSSKATHKSQRNFIASRGSAGTRFVSKNHTDSIIIMSMKNVCPESLADIV
jgi:hypothetical protein